jgi:hypothetical protein
MMKFKCEIEKKIFLELGKKAIFMSNREKRNVIKTVRLFKEALPCLKLTAKSPEVLVTGQNNKCQGEIDFRVLWYLAPEDNRPHGPK